MTNPIHLAIQVTENPFVRAGKKKIIDRRFMREDKDGRVLADDRFLEQVLGKRIHPTPEVSLDEIMTYVSAE
jgi:hypothetical protein